MPEAALRDCRILVVEDEYMLADEFQTELAQTGATVLGPVATVEGALRLIAVEENIDGAVLDMNLGGEMVFPVADLLAERGVPFVFTTGYDPSEIPTRFSDIVRLEKPIRISSVGQAIERLIQA